MTVSGDRAAHAGRAREYDTGTVLYHEGDEGDTLYIVQRGQVALRRQRGERGEHEELEQAERGDFFGELSVINGSPRDATATVVEPSRLLEIDVPTFERMLKDNAEIAVRIIRKMATRIDRLRRRPMSSEVRMALAAATKAQDADTGGRAPPAAIEAPAAAPIEPAASWPPTAAPIEPAASWPPTAAPAAPAAPAGGVPVPVSWDPGGHALPAELYADGGHALPRRRRRNSPAWVFFAVVLTLAGLAGLIAAIAMMHGTAVTP